MIVEIQGVAYTVKSLEQQSFRCGKIITSVILRSQAGDTEISMDTAGNWLELLGVKDVTDRTN